MVAIFLFYYALLRVPEQSNTRLTDSAILIGVVMACGANIAM
jgi:hypothetical protein